MVSIFVLKAGFQEKADALVPSNMHTEPRCDGDVVERFVLMLYAERGGFLDGFFVVVRKGVMAGLQRAGCALHLLHGGSSDQPIRTPTLHTAHFHQFSPILNTCPGHPLGLIRFAFFFSENAVREGQRAREGVAGSPPPLLSGTLSSDQSSETAEHVGAGGSGASQFEFLKT